jgi:hypothetical protein
MADKAFFKRMARAIADEDPDIPGIARRLAEEIEEARANLRSEADMIRNMAAFSQGLVGEEADAAGLSESERVAINALIDTMLTGQPNISPEAMADAVTASGIPLASRVSNPAAVIGTMLYHGRRRREARAGSQPPTPVVLPDAAPRADNPAAPASTAESPSAVSQLGSVVPVPAVPDAAQPAQSQAAG